MKNILFIYLLFIISCSANYEISQSNLVPMYGHINKTDNFLQADDHFIQTAISECGTREKAAQEYANIAWAYLSKNDNSTAMKRFNQVWLLDSLNTNAYFGFSACYELSGKSGKEYFIIGKKFDQNNEIEIKYYKLLSLIYPYYYNNNDKSLECCNNLLEIDKDNHFALQQRGHLYVVKEKWDLAVNDFINAEKIDTLTSESYNDCAYSYEQLRKYYDALIFYEKSNKVNPQFIQPLYNAALLLVKLKNYPEALEKINKCIQLKPNVNEFKELKSMIEKKE